MTAAKLDPRVDYPLAEHRPDLIKTPTGKGLDEISMAAVLAGDVVAEDLRIAPETLRLQAEIAEEVGNKQLGQNFRRAAEMTALSDTLVLKIYNSLRPNASTKQELLDIATDLERNYAATLCGQLVREAAEVYERRDVLANR